MRCFNEVTTFISGSLPKDDKTTQTSITIYPANEEVTDTVPQSTLIHPSVIKVIKSPITTFICTLLENLCK